MNYWKKLGPGIFLWKLAPSYQFLGFPLNKKSVVNCSSRCKVPLAYPGSSGFSAGESRVQWGEGLAPIGVLYYLGYTQMGLNRGLLFHFMSYVCIWKVDVYSESHTTINKEC